MKAKTTKLDAWILQNRISLGSIVRLKQRILNSLTKYAQKVCFHWKSRKLKVTIEFCTFKVALVLNFNLNWQFSFFGPNLHKNGISGLKNERLHWILHIPVFLMHPISHSFDLIWFHIQNSSFEFLDKICVKWEFPV